MTNQEVAVAADLVSPATTGLREETVVLTNLPMPT
jgi:hypothetical protein